MSDYMKPIIARNLSQPAWHANDWAGRTRCIIFDVLFCSLIICLEPKVAKSKCYYHIYTYLVHIRPNTACVHIHLELYSLWDLRDKAWNPNFLTLVRLVKGLFPTISHSMFLQGFTKWRASPETPAETAIWLPLPCRSLFSSVLKPARDANINDNCLQWMSSYIQVTHGIMHATGSSFVPNIHVVQVRTIYVTVYSD